MKLPVEVDPRAEEEARAAYLWYLERSEQAATAFENELSSAVEQIGLTPTAFQLVDDELRRYVLHRFPYSVLHEIGESAVRVVAVAHQHRKPGYWLTRE